MISFPSTTTLTQFNEEAKKAFLAKRFVDALRLYDEGLEKSFDENPQTLNDLLKIAGDSLRAGGGGDVDGVLRAAVLSSFILRLKPFYFDATATYVGALTSANDAAGARGGGGRRRGVEEARVVLKHHLAKDGTDEEAKRLLNSLEEDDIVFVVDETVGEEEADAADTTSSTGVSAFRLPAVLEDLPPDFASTVGNALNNSALCELKLKRFDAAAASASQALLFLTAPEARVKAVFRHAQALLRTAGIASSATVASEAEKLVREAEEHLTTAEAKILRVMLAEAKGKHDWANLLKECLKDERKIIDPAEYLNPKLALGYSLTKGLGLVAKERLKKGELLCVQQAVHYVAPKKTADSDEHLDFPKTLLAEVLKDARNEAALRLLARRGEQIKEEDKKLPSIAQAFRRSQIHLPHLRDPMSVTQVREETKKCGGDGELPLETYKGTTEYESESRRLASLVSDVVKKMSRLSTPLALSFDVRYKKTMTQSGGEPELSQLGLWTMPSLLHHAEFPNVTFGTMGGVAVISAIRDVEEGTPLTAMMGGIQCLPSRLRHLASMGFVFPQDFDPDHPLKPSEVDVVAAASATFDEANDLKMKTVGMDSGEAKPVFEKAVDVCYECINGNKDVLVVADPLGLAALYFTMADCLGGKNDLSGMIKAYFMGIKYAHSAVVVNLDTLTRMTKMQKFIPVAKRLEEMQDQAEMVAKNNPSLQEEFQKIAKIQRIGPSIDKIRDFLEENLSKGCALIFSTPEALRLLS